MSDKDLDINELLAKYATNATQFIANEETIDQLIKEGLRIKKVAPLPYDEYVDQLFEGKKERAKALIRKLPPPSKVALPPINSLYDEIKDCILFGLNGAAITLSAILVEFAIKHAIVDHTKGVEVYDKKEWDRLEHMDLADVIKEASSHKLFNPNEIKRLNNFKNDVRNPYLHYNIKKITTGAIMKEAFAYDSTKKKVIKKYNLKAEDNPFLWQPAKKHIDEQMVLTYYLFADSIVKKLFGN